MRTLRTFLLAAVCGVCGHAGSLSVDIDFNTLFAHPGETITAHGSITNIDTAIVDINSCAMTLPGAFTTDSCNTFLFGPNAAPLFLQVGESADVDFFIYTPDSPFDTSGGVQFSGVFTILGTPEISGYDGSAQNDLVDAPFVVTVVPEPSTFALFGLALPAAWALRRRRARKA